jgi:integrase
MACIWKHPKSKYWMARFYDLNGKRRNRSTKTEDRKEARKLAAAYEDAARRKRTALQSRRVISALHKEITGEGLPVSTVREFCNRWLEVKTHETKPATMRFYRNEASKFLNFLGDRADGDIGEVAKDDILSFRANQAKTLAAKTVNHGVKFLRMVFRSAREDATIADNPAEFVKVVKAVGDRKSRRPFSIEELRAVLSVADEEWKSMILFGLYSGQRLGDIARLTWANLDLQAAELRLVASKTQKTIIQPLAGPLKVHVESLPVSDDANAPIHPRAFETVGRQGKAGGLSNQFAVLLAHAGLRKKQAHRKTHGEGRGVKSSSSGLSFHCLRHTAVSLLKEAGIPAATVMELVGHDSAQMSEHYTHIGRESLKQAAEVFPDLTTGDSKRNEQRVCFQERGKAPAA